MSKVIDKTELEALQKLIAEGPLSSHFTCLILSNMVRPLGKVKPVVDSVWKFEDALKAYEKLMTNRARGKIIVEAPSSE